MSTKQSSELSEQQVNQVVAERLKSIRLMHQFSQKDLASLMSVSIQQIQKYERGSNRISPGKLYLIANALSIEINHFYPAMHDHQQAMIHPKDRSKDLVRTMKSSDLRKMMLKIIDLIPPNQRDSISAKE